MNQNRMEDVARIGGAEVGAAIEQVLSFNEDFPFLTDGRLPWLSNAFGGSTFVGRVAISCVPGHA